MIDLKTLVPLRTKEEIRRDAAGYGGDEEKVATTSVKSLSFLGVELTSRYNKAIDYQEMASVIMKIHPDRRRHISEMWCDSKAGRVYRVSMRATITSRDEAEGLAALMEYIMLEDGPGHGGIYVKWQNKDFHLAGCWRKN
jgi:hypothetical protein